MRQCCALPTAVDLAHAPNAFVRARRGRYTFRFYKVAAGGWVNVTIDDLLPIDRTGQLVFSGAATAMPSTEVAQAQALWPALFEKA